MRAACSLFVLCETPNSARIARGSPGTARPTGRPRSSAAFPAADLWYTMCAMRKTTLQYRVPYADTDQMGVVYYGNYLTIFERARNELMRACGYTYKQCEAEGWMLPVTHAEVNYHRPARYDDLLEVTAWCSSHKGVRLEITCEVRVNGELLVDGFTRHCFVSTTSFRPIPPPEKFLAILDS